MKKLLFVLLLVVCFVSTGLAVPTFYVAPNIYPSYSSTLDMPWQNAVGNYHEYDFDTDIVGAYNLIGISDSSFGVNISVGLSGLNGTTTGGEIYPGCWGELVNGAIYGTFYGNGLLNHDMSGLVHSKITFAFDKPVGDRKSVV